MQRFVTVKVFFNCIQFLLTSLQKTLRSERNGSAKTVIEERKKKILFIDETIITVRKYNRIFPLEKINK